jgi:flagellar motor switch protein FliG
MATANVRKAAVLLLSLPQGQSAALLGRLEPDQAAAVSAAMGGIREVGGAEQEAVAREFAAAAGTAIAPFQFLHDCQSDVLLDAIADEQPQTIAIILSHLPPRQAAAVLTGLPPEKQVSVVCRIAAIGEISPAVLRDLENGLRHRLFGASGRPVDSRCVASVVRMLNVMRPASERRLLSALAEADPPLLRQIRRTMFGVDVAACGDRDLVEAAC